VTDPTNLTPAERLLTECGTCLGTAKVGCTLSDCRTPHECGDCSGSGLDPEKVRALEEVKDTTLRAASLYQARCAELEQEGTALVLKYAIDMDGQRARIRELEAEVSTLNAALGIAGSPPAGGSYMQRLELAERTNATLRAEVEKFRYTSDKQAVAWKDRALKAEAEVEHWKTTAECHASIMLKAQDAAGSTDDVDMIVASLTQALREAREEGERLRELLAEVPLMTHASGCASAYGFIKRPACTCYVARVRAALSREPQEPRG